VTNCAFSGNTASSGGGMYNGGGSPTITNCTFSGNTADDGGGIYNTDCSPTITNCSFSGNSAGYEGGGMCNTYCSPIVTNCTFSGNSAGNGGGMCNQDGGWQTVINCIFWDNTAPLGTEIYTTSLATPTFRHCDIRGGWNPALGADGGGNIMSDPRFVAPATPAGADGLWRTSDDGLRLQPDSPCIGAADPAVAPETDILGLTRKAAPDIGAYEFPSGGYCTLTYNTGPGGSISGITPQTVDYGTSGTAVEAVPSIGYHFVQWSDASTANPRTDTNVTTDVAVTATFAINTYTLTYNAGADGSISGATPQTVDYGADGSEVTAVPDVGHRFVRWSDGVMTASRTDTNVTADINVTAIFAPSKPAAVQDWALYE
jgi:predicted outer membrane repeat protein